MWRNGEISIAFKLVRLLQALRPLNTMQCSIRPDVFNKKGSKEANTTSPDNQRASSQSAVRRAVAATN